MKKIYLLTKTMLKGSTSPFEGSNNKSTKPMSIPMKLLIAFAVVFGLGSIAILFGVFIDYLLNQLILLNQAYLAVHFFLLGGAMFTFIMSIIITPATYYFDDSMEHYLVLPITRREYLSAKWIVNAISISMMLLPFSAIFIFTFILKVSGSWVHLPILITALLAVPLIPISVVVFFVVLLFKAVPFVRNKNVYVYFTSGIGLIFGLSINFLMEPLLSNDKLVESLIAGLSGGEGNTLVNLVSSVIPTISLFVKSMTQNNVLYFVGAVVVTIAIIYLTILFTQYNYLDSALSMKESGQTHKVLSEDKLSDTSQHASAFKALIRQDLRNILRTPIFASNYFIPILIIPIMISFAFISGDIPLGSIDDISFQFNSFMLGADLLQYAALTFVIFLLMGYGLGSFSTMTSTSFSREGTNMQTILQLPIPLSLVLKAKLALGMMVTAVIPVILVFGIQIVLRAPIVIFLCALVSTLIGVACANVTSIFLDVLKPKLVWATDQEAVKQNFLSIIPMFGSFGVLGVAFWMMFQDAAPWMFVLYAVAIILVSGLLYYYLSVKGVKQLKQQIQEM